MGKFIKKSGFPSWLAGDLAALRAVAKKAIAKSKSDDFTVGDLSSNGYLADGEILLVIYEYTGSYEDQEATIEVANAVEDKAKSLGWKFNFESGEHIKEELRLQSLHTPQLKGAFIAFKIKK
jgi:hypothetical protein